MSTIAAAAEIIADHRRRRRPLPALPDALRPRAIEDGYEVQDAVHAALEPDLGRRIGWKIGCTTRVMQDYLAIASPCAGGLFSETTHGRAVRLGRGDAVRAGIECEIAVRLGRDLDAAGAADPDTVAAAIDSYFAAIEVVDDRYESWRTIGTPTLIADDFFAAGAVLGPAVAASAVEDPAALDGRTIIDEQIVGEGWGRDILGHPHAALAWLAGHLGQRGRSLAAGEIVLLGSLVRTMWLEPGATARIEIGGLGQASLEIEA